MLILFRTDDDRSVDERLGRKRSQFPSVCELACTRRNTVGRFTVDLLSGCAWRQPQKLGERFCGPQPTYYQCFVGSSAHVRFSGLVQKIETNAEKFQISKNKKSAGLTVKSLRGLLIVGPKRSSL